LPVFQPGGLALAIGRCRRIAVCHLSIPAVTAGRSDDCGPVRWRPRAPVR